jgi:membrane-bound metal-dependent hydrolase YbcI (DUF457 family)
LLVYLNPALVNPAVDAFGIAQYIWAILIIAVAVLLCLLVLFTRKDISYSLVFVWALLGIVIKRISDYVSVAATGGIGIVVILVSIMLVWSRYWRRGAKGAREKS